MKVKLLFMGLLLGLSACVESPDQRLSRVYNHTLKSNAPAYAQGYRDGCASGYHLAGDERYSYRKSALRTQQEPLYSRGWRDAYPVCLREAKEEKADRDRLHNRIYHGGRNPHPDETDGYDGHGDGRRLSEIHQTEEEREIWEGLKK